MKIKIVRSAFVGALSLVKDTCEGKDSLNILRCVRIDAENGKIVLTASNLDQYVMTSVCCEVSEPGSAALVGSSLFGFVSALPKGEVELELKDGSSKAYVSGGNCRYTIAVGEIAMWPTPSSIKGEGASSFSMSGQTLNEVFRKVEYAASVDETRRSVCGVNMSAENDLLTFVATDGRRLSFVEVVTENAGKFSVTMTSKTVKRLKKLIGKGCEKISIITDGSHISFASDDAGWSMQSKLVADAYPNWRNVVPTAKTNVATMDRSVLLDEVNRASLSSGESRRVRFTLENGSLHLEAIDCDFSRAKTSLPVKYTGEKVMTDLNSDLVKDILGCFDDDDVRISFGNGTGPVMFECAIPFGAVVMPLRSC